MIFYILMRHNQSVKLALYKKQNKTKLLLVLIACTCKKRLACYPSQGGMKFTKLSLAGNNLIIPGQGEFG